MAGPTNSWSAVSTQPCGQAAPGTLNAYASRDGHEVRPPRSSKHTFVEHESSVRIFWRPQSHGFVSRA